MRHPDQERPRSRRSAPAHPALDLPLLVASSALLGLGLVMVASASLSISAKAAGGPFHYLIRHALYLGLGVGAAALVLHLPLALWERASPYLLMAGMLLLGLVFLPGIGHEVNGSARWLRVGPLTFQPSEAMKLGVILYLSGYLVRRSGQVRDSLAGFVKPVAVLLGISALILLEPDFGSAVVLFVTALAMLFLAGVPFTLFLSMAAAVAAALGGIALLEPYRVARLISFTNPWADPFGSGFQLTQALIATGRGGWFGVGLGEGVQKLFYLPEAHTDFLFAVLAEELGFAGVIGVVALFAFVGLRAIRIGRRAEAAGQPFGAYVAYGIGLLVVLQAFLNIGVNLGLLPTKGLPLPLMSYGGTSLLATCTGIGLLLRVARESRPAR